MARYINEDEFIAWVKEHWCADCQNDNGLRCRVCWIDDAIDIVEEAPEADVVEIVRCKDCIYRFRKNGHDKDGCPLDRDGMMGDNDFCSCGERKEGNE